MAPRRALRPGRKRPALEPPTPHEVGECPFCEGREDRTPPETFALGRGDASPDTPGWKVRVVPNLYPALERQEVVVHVPRHARTVAELAPDELALVAAAWRERAAAARADGFGYVQALLNEGREAGASLPHSHSQLAWLREAPPLVAAEDGRPGCSLCDFLPRELDDGARVVTAERGVVLLSAYAGRLPFELLVAPIDHPNTGAFDSELLPTALELLGDAVRRLYAVEGPVPLNAWVHDGRHWHVEIVPRLSVLAGLELGAGIWINSAPPEEAAAHLREAGS